MNVGNRTESAQFPEKKYINGIFLAVLRVEVLFIYLGVTVHVIKRYK
jgi:hypothetical protein